MLSRLYTGVRDVGKAIDDDIINCTEKVSAIIAAVHKKYPLPVVSCIYNKLLVLQNAKRLQFKSFRIF